MVVAYILWHYARAIVFENYSREHRVITEDAILQTSSLPFPILQSPWWNKTILRAGTEKENCSENSCPICLLMQQASTQNCHRERERTSEPFSLLLGPTHSRPGWDGSNFPFGSRYGAVLWFVTKHCWWHNRVLAMVQQYLHRVKAFSFSHYASPVSILEVRKRLWGHNCNKWSSNILYPMMLCSAIKA